MFQIVSLDFGMGPSNPINKVWFYAKKQPQTAIRIKPDDVRVTINRNITLNWFTIHVLTCFG